MTKEAGGILSALLSILPKESREFIGVYVMILAPMALIYGIIYLPQILGSMTKPSEKCWELQELKERIFKVNTCTGKIEEVFLKDKKSSMDTTKITPSPPKKKPLTPSDAKS